MNELEVSELQKLIDEANNIVFFGGAGVSTSSGIKDFRGKNGLYKSVTDYPPEYLLSSACFYKGGAFYEKDLLSIASLSALLCSFRSNHFSGKQHCRKI